MMNKKLYLEQFENTKDFLERLRKAYEDGFIFEDEQVMVKWLDSMGQLSNDIFNIRQQVGIEFYSNHLEAKTEARIKELEEELDNIH